MAYDASNINGNNPNVASSTPLTTGTNQSNQNQPQNQPQQQSNMAQPSAPQSSSTGQKKASSGMFTNIQKYVSANQPQAQKMAQAATQGVQKDTAGVAQAIKNQQAQQQQAVKANVEKQQQAMQFAEKKVQDIMGTGQPVQQPAGTQTPNAPAQETAQQPIQPSQEDVDQFQKYLKGEAGFGSVNAMNLAPEQVRMQGLQNIASRVGDESGRRELLKKTFGNRDYTRGQSGLDQLIVSGDKAAREQMITGTRQAVQGAEESLRRAGLESQEAIEADRLMRSRLGEDIRGLVTGEKGQGAITSALDEQMKQAQAERDRLAAAYQNQQAAIKAVQDKYKNLDAAQLENIIADELGLRGTTRITGYSLNENGVLVPTTQTLEEAIKAGDKGALDEFMIKSNAKERNMQILDQIISDADAKILGINKEDLVNNMPSLRDKGSQKNGASFADILDAVNENIEKLKSVDYGSQLAQQLGGSDISSILSKENITQEAVADQAQRDKYLALQTLLGNTGGLFSGTAPVGSALTANQQLEQALKQKDKQLYGISNYFTGANKSSFK